MMTLHTHNTTGGKYMETNPSRIDIIHNLFNELHANLGKYAVRYGVDVDKVNALGMKIDATHHDFSEIEMNRKSPSDMLTLRMLGDNVTFRRYQWQQLSDDLAADSELRHRIDKMLKEPKDEAAIIENADRYGSASS
jgi:hypothetical protein